MSHATPEQFSLHIVSEHGTTAWALGHGTGPQTVDIVAGGRFDAPESDTLRRQIITAMIDHLTDTDAYREHRLIDVSVFDTAARRLLLDLGGRFGVITILYKSQMTHEEGWDRHGWRHCRNLLSADASSARAASDRRRVEAATDGSVGWGRGKGASWAWAREDGRYGYGTMRTADVLVVELRAIHELILAAETGEHLLIDIDSKLAIAALTRDPGKGRVRHSSTAENLVRAIKHSQEKMHAVEYRWVKGHQGHPLNDAADRLARTARQTAVGVTETTRNSIARNIMADTMSRHHQAA
ncbi:RNase H family protein [Curtobacterium sp. MCBD17_040]|uniref:ribonuclease HI n=1 Tax=Curtobacterium sp. MCBD17_040 TaxID=2175674 RepID=UPI000DA78C26|nr:RNase H family protein [Curtobacterium sp. MCBD17_040]WIB65332.1 hypothetical protein DEI94_18165 [Curtobacterium sp. MCBD17_040]